MRYSQEYMEQQKQLHAKGDYGVSGYKHADRIRDLATQMKTKQILDYGCGQQTLQKGLPFPITNYDPFIKGCDSEPDVHDLVVCSDVLEHIEPNFLGTVLAHIRSKTRQVLFTDVANRPAEKVLSDGRNAHLIQEPSSWWLTQLMPYGFEPMFLQTYAGGFVAVYTVRADSA